MIRIRGQYFLIGNFFFSFMFTRIVCGFSVFFGFYIFYVPGYIWDTRFFFRALTRRVCFTGIFARLLFGFFRAMLNGGRLAWTTGRHHDHVAVAQPVLWFRPVVRYWQRVSVQSGNKSRRQTIGSERPLRL